MITQQKTIRGEIRNLAVVVILLVLLITFVFGAAYKIVSEKNEAETELGVLAEVTALNSQSALMFNDRHVSEETLSALEPRADILSAEIINLQGESIAKRHFDRAGTQFGDANKGYRFIRDLIAHTLGESAVVIVERPVKMNGKPLGSIRLHADLKPVWIDILYSLTVSVITALLTLLAASLLINRMLKNIMRPIEKLSASAALIAKTRQYSQRVEKLADDELGILTEQFNLMLDEVENRDKELIEQNDFLEREVDGRTQAIRTTMEEMRSLLDSMPEGAFGVDMDGNCKFVNTSCLRILGYDTAEALIGKDIYSLIRPAVSNGYAYSAEEEKIRSVYRYSRPAHAADEIFVRKDGSSIPVEYWSQPMVVDGVAQGVTTTFIDITERKKAETELKIAAAAFDSQESMMVMDADRMILRVNQSFSAITGYTPEEVVGKSGSMFRSGREKESFFMAMWDTINSEGSWQGEVWHRRKNGEVYPGHVSISAVKNQQGVVTNYVSTLTDITMTKAAEQEIRNLAFYDPLTGLPNRRLLLDRISQALSYSARSGKKGALLFIDLDHFKTLNDTAGHAVGDQLLQQVAARLSTAVREGDTVVRLGGDEFVVMLEDLSEHALEAAAQTEAVGVKILEAISAPYMLGEHEHHSTSSIGATLFNDHECNMDDLLKQADIAMYQAKKAGRSTLRFFDPEMQETINTRAALETELHRAIERQEFQLYYQLQVGEAGRALSAEVLIRWVHPERGLIVPTEFIPLAEETGLIIPIGNWVLDNACAQIKVWQQSKQTEQLSLSVNVSARQFYEPDFVNQVRTAVEKHAINPAQLKLELTESMMLDQVDRAIETMSALKEIGVRFSLDDFGTGYSSLQYLKKLPLSQLKIDQSFVRDIADDVNDQAIVRTIIAMAETLNLNVIAEGVETEQQRQLLQTNGCNTYQGYLFSRPLPLQEFESLLQQFSDQGN